MAVTPPEEIARQHAAARVLVADGTPPAPRVDRGEVPLAWKERPFADLPRYRAREESTTECGGSGGTGGDPRHEANADGGVDGGPTWCISSRGQVDVSRIAKIVRPGYNDPPPPSDDGKKQPLQSRNRRKRPSGGGNKRGAPLLSNLWDERNAASTNVKITRPSHDAWGIRKVVLVFCDDFLSTIYTLPWYQRKRTHGNALNRAVQPILDLLQIDQSQVVRCLFAGLPPGVTIPVHHDTGEWVKFTHRIHVPIILSDPNKVIFRCGPTEDLLERIDCTPGHVFEMNNQAKHAVSNCSDEYRVHLILDYVDPSFFETREREKCPTRRVNLEPGEVLTQTRRSIDRALDAGKRKHPSFLVLGAQKAGTTSLYEYLNQHPWVVRARRRETHCLDWRWDGSLSSTEARRKHCLGFYHAENMRRYPSLITGDSTPSYLLDYYRVIPRVKECFDHVPAMFVMVRDPIARAVSHYAMVTSDDGTPEQLATRGVEWRNKTIEEVFEEDLSNMIEDGLLPYWDAESRTVDMAAFEEFADSREEDEAWERYVTNRIPLNTGSYSPLARGMYALQCRQWFSSFPPEKFLVMRLEDMKTKGSQWAADEAASHLGLPKFNLPDSEKRNSREYGDPLGGKGELRGWLERLFKPHNERFGRLVVEELGYDWAEWKDPWSYGE